MRILTQVVCILLFLLLPLFGEARADDFKFDKAEQAFRVGDFSEASRIYLDAIQKGHNTSSELFYNLGAAFYKKGELGAAVAAFLRARELAPSDPDIQYNITFLLGKIQDKLTLEIPGAHWKIWSAARWFGDRALLAWATLFFSLGLLVLAWYFYNDRRPFAKISASILFGIMGLYGALSLVDRLYLTPDWGAVASAELNVLASPSLKNGVVIFQVYKIQLSDAKMGWVPSHQLVIFGKRHYSYQNPKVFEDSGEAPL
ncbi:MAG: tetratricopeptide repeat protein [Proteobacteria bacterium]|nr:tetratricopeptide repeat protein [Pseudomonadota bacterium]